MYLNQYKLPLHKVIITYTLLHSISVTHLTFSTETLGHMLFPHKARDHVAARLQKELICLVSAISRLSNDHRLILSSSSKIGWMGSQLLKYLRIKAIAVGRTSVC